MKITCIGHSGFLLEAEPDYNLIFDYYTDNKNIITPEIFRNKHTYVFVSHKHHDHYNEKIFDWSEWGTVYYILDSDCTFPQNKENVFSAREGDNISLPGGVCIKAYGSTDEGVSYLVTAGIYTVFHAGDLNDWYWEKESTPAELADEEEKYLNIIRKLAGKKINAAFIPEDPRLGAHAGRAIRLFKEIVAPDKIIPMHYPGNEGIIL